jgi:EAL domain-containing protein (putative c-di-GMP-specific phosphodiesterase class I)
LEYQPKIKLSTNQIERVEALIRWNHPLLGIIPPGDFIPKLKKTLSIRKVTWWVVEKAIKDIKDWQSRGINLSVAVNICQKDITGRNFVKKLFEILERNNVEPKYLELEITETDIITDKECAMKVLSLLRMGGIKISIDDFGTGYSSLSYLSSLPIDFIKIDKSFIKDILNNEKKQNLVKNTIDMSHILGKGVVVEGVEDEKTFDLLKNLNCEQIQGFYISKGIVKEKLEIFLKKYNKK